MMLVMGFGGGAGNVKPPNLSETEVFSPNQG